MLSSSQVGFVWHVSGWVYMGMTSGAVCGMLVGAVIRAMRTRDAFGFGAGVIYGLVPGAIGGSLIAMGSSVLITFSCEPGRKAGYEVPEWLDWTLCSASFAFAPALAAWAAVPVIRARRSRWPSLVVQGFGWAILGAVIGSVEEFRFGFGQYGSDYYLGGMHEPIRYAITGFVFGGAAALLWRCAVEWLARYERARWQSAPNRHVTA